MTRPTRAVRLASPAALAERRADGTVLLRSPEALPAYPSKITERLEHWAERTPERVFLAQRDANGAWQRLTYAEVRAAARRVAQALLDRGLSAERPLAVLSGNDLQHALLELGALYAGIPYAPVSPAYSLVSRDFAKLRQVMRVLTPGLVFAARRAPFQAAVAAAVPGTVEVLYGEDFDRLAQTAEGAAVEEAHARVGPDTIAKLLFTSGSTGEPKAVINTQRMWCANQAMVRATLAFVADEPPVLLEWAPWHHTAGGNKQFGLALFNGGTLHLDEGSPLPGAIEATVRNLREVSPTFYFNVPKGFEALLPFLRADAALRESLFRNLKVLWFAGAGVSQPVFDDYRRLSYETCGEEILFLTGCGATETAPYTLARTWPSDDASNLGLPPPGVDAKLAPLEGGRYELRVRGPHVTPGYWRAPQLTEAAFDEEGYYRMGDVFEFAGPQDPGGGLLFRGRLSEDFKLDTGTWVQVGPLRARFLEHFAPMVRDVVIAGEGRGELAALVFPAEQFDAAQFRARLETLPATGSSNRIRRYAILEEAPSLDAGEITDKGSINQRAVLRRRAAIVDALYR